MNRYSRQRELIKRAVLDNPVHPTAEQVYNMVRETDESVSLGTVYRNLRLLCDRGELAHVPIANGSDRFDGTLRPHYHAVCVECGEVFDVEYDLSGVAEAAREQCGVEVRSVQLVINAVCHRCRGEGSR